MYVVMTKSCNTIPNQRQNYCTVFQVYTDRNRRYEPYKKWCVLLRVSHSLVLFVRVRNFYRDIPLAASNFPFKIPCYYGTPMFKTIKIPTFGPYFQLLSSIPQQFCFNINLIYTSLLLTTFLIKTNVSVCITNSSLFRRVHNVANSDYKLCHVCPPHRTPRLPLDWYLLHLSNDFSKTCREISSL